MQPSDIIVRENHEPLVRLDPVEFDLKPQYVKQGLTTESSIWLRESVVDKLRLVKEQLPPGWNVRIWDGWRPIWLQKLLYELIGERLRKQHPYVNQEELAELVSGYIYPPTTNPPAPHSTGGTIDLTLVDETGQAVNFGTGFDEFKERAHADYFDRHAPKDKADAQAKQNRQLFYFFMEAQDFVVNPREWWHWTYGTVQWAAARGIERALYASTEPPTI